MGALVAVVKFIGPPGSIPLLVSGLAAGWAVVRFWPRRRRLAYLWIGILIATYLVLAVPVVAHAIAGQLPVVTSADIRSIGPLDSVVLFDGDNRVGRAQVTAQLMQSSNPARIIILGQRWLARRLVALGVPNERIELDSNPPTTQAQMSWMQTNVPRRTGTHTVVVVSRLQLPRVEALARAQGQPLTLIGAPVDIEPPTSGGWSVVPSYAALRISRDAIYELAALAYYERRGDIHAQGK